jgi:hypothetical protein
MGVELGLKVNPKNLAVVVLLGREDVRDEVVPIEEPPTSENIQDVKNRGDVGLLDPQRGRAASIEDRRRRGGQLQLLVGKREDGRGELASSSGRGIHHRKEMVVVKVQEGMFPIAPPLSSRSVPNL